MEWLSVEMLSRMQFAVAVFFHFLFVPLTLGLSLLIAVMQTIYYRTGDDRYKRLVRFWGRLFLINFAVGVVTGISLVFQFGTNWSRYAEYVGGVFGPLLAIEATVAFFLESTFIAVWHFGWERVNKKLHLAAIWLVTLAGNISAIWIILANGWMQNPTGYTEIDGIAQLTSLGDFVTVVSNPYAWGQFFHTILSTWLLGGFFVLGISAWQILRGRQADLFGRCVKLAAPFTLVAVLCLMLVGHMHGNTMSRVQPTKLAAMELLWDTQKSAPFHIFQWPDVENERNSIELIPIPGMLSFLAYSDFDAEVQGLKDFPKEDRPPVLPVFLGFRLMVALGGLFLLLSAMACLYRKDLGRSRLTAWLLFLNLPLPYIAIAAGWMLAEVGRQPWIIYGIKRTADMASPIPASSVGVSLLAFTLAYAFLGLVALYLMRRVVMQGAEDAPLELAAGTPLKQITGSPLQQAATAALDQKSAMPATRDGGENHD